MERIRPYLVEILLIVTAMIITGIAITLHFQNKKVALPEVERTSVKEDTNLSEKNNKLFIDVSGAVMKPDLYEATPGSRLKDVIELAGGLSEDADKSYIARNFNMSKFVSNQEKIYIPSTSDIANGMFTESPKVLEYLSSDISTQNQSTDSQIAQNGHLISINDSGIDELDMLPGIGPVSAQKIIDNRPYTTMDELVSKKIVNTSTFEKIKDLISL